MNALELAMAIRDRALASLDDVEVLVERTDRLGYLSQNAPWMPSLERGIWAIGMRSLVGGRIASVSSSVPDVAQCVDLLVRASARGISDPLTRFATVPSVRDDHRNDDPAVTELLLDSSKLRQLASALERNARAVTPAFSLQGLELSLSVSRTHRVVATREGCADAWSTALEQTTLIDGDHYFAHAATHLESKDTIVMRAAEAIRSLPAREVTPEQWLGSARECTAVYEPDGLEFMLRRLLVERVALDRVLHGTWKTQPGDRLAHASISLIDDATASHSLRGAPTDDEGVASTRKEILARGIVKTILSDRRTATVAGTTSTGNGYRVPFITEDRIEAPVRIAMSHLEMQQGEVPRDSIAKGRSILVPQLLSLHSGSKSTGQFNSPVMGGVALEDGVPVARLASGAWSLTGDVHSLLNDVEGISIERHHTGTGLFPWLASRVRVG